MSPAPLTRSSRFLTIAALTAAAAGGPCALGDTLSWGNSAGGTAGLASNWAPAQLPSFADSLVFNLSTVYPVTFPASVTASSAQTYKRGVVTATLASPHASAEQIKVGHTATDNARLRIVSGRLSAGTFGVIGQDGGSVGAVEVVNGDAELTSTDDLIIGQAGTGTLEVTLGADVTTDAEVRIGNLATGDGSVSLSGVAPSDIPFPLFPDRAGLHAAGPGGNILIGVAGTGTLTAGAGSSVLAEGSMSVGLNAGSDGSVTVRAQGGPLGSGGFTVNGDLSVGRNTASAAAGTGLFEVAGDARVTIGGTTRIGDAAGGSGTLRMTDGQMTTHGLSIDPVNGVPDFDGGTLRVEAGVFAPPTPGFSFGGAIANTPTLILDEAASLTLTQNLTVADAPGRAAAMFVLDGSTASASHTLIAAGAGSVGTLDVGAGSTVSGAGLFVGGNPAAQGGTGTLTVGPTGTVSLGGPVKVWPGSQAVVDGGTLNAGEMEVRGLLTLNNGLVNSDLDIINGHLAGSGTVLGEVFIAAGISTVTATGPLSMGDPASEGGYLGVGTLDAGAHAVTLRDLDAAETDEVVIAGGSITTAAGLFSHDSITGFGTLNGPVENRGLITAQGTGLTFNGPLTGIGSGIGGTSITFGAQGGFTGTGAIAARIVGVTGSVITATGPLTLGLAADPSGFGTGGELHCGAEVVRLNDSADAVLGSLTTIAQARLEAPGGLLLLGGRRLTGSGLITGALNNSGILDPEPGASIEGGLIRVNGHYRGAAATAEMRMGLGEPGGLDRLVVNPPFTAAIGGGLTVTLRPGFTPGNLQSFSVVQATGGLAGVFETTALPPKFRVIYTPTEVRVFLCGADFNNSGSVSVQDIFDYLAAYFAGGPGADFNTSGAVSVQDIFDFLSAYFTGC